MMIYTKNKFWTVKTKENSLKSSFKYSDIKRKTI